MITDTINRLRDRGMGPFEARAEDGSAYVLSGENVLCECAILEEAEVIAETLTAVFEGEAAEQIEELTKEAEALAEQIENLEEDGEKLQSELEKNLQEVRDLEADVVQLTEEVSDLRKKDGGRK